jgi:hypothetical protein
MARKSVGKAYEVVVLNVTLKRSAAYNSILYLIYLFVYFYFIFHAGICIVRVCSHVIDVIA